jgi:thioredoxin reductase (NADPH)
MNKIYDVAVIGSGPAGLTAAIYTTRGAASTVIIGGDSWGGQLMLTSVVDNFPGFPEGIMGPDLMEKIKAQAVRFGAEFIQKNVSSVDFSTRPFVLKTSDQELRANSVIVATGAETKWLGIPGEKELIGRGVSSCAPCDAPFFKEKEVLVIGGGDSAMEEALVLSKFASKVTIIHRRGEFKASKIMQDKVFANKKISVIWDSEVTKVEGDGKVEQVEIKNTKTEKLGQIKCDGVFVAIGHSPSTQIFKGILDMDEKGYIVPSQKSEIKSQKYNTQTSIEGVFVSGDVHDYRYKQAITAAGFGCMAAIDALNFLENEK